LIEADGHEIDNHDRRISFLSSVTHANVTSNEYQAARWKYYFHRREGLAKANRPTALHGTPVHGSSYLGQGPLPCTSLTGEFIGTPSTNVFPFTGLRVTTPLLFSIAQCTGSTPVPASKISASRLDPSEIVPAGNRRRNLLPRKEEIGKEETGGRKRWNEGSQGRRRTSLVLCRRPASEMQEDAIAQKGRNYQEARLNIAYYGLTTNVWKPSERLACIPIGILAGLVTRAPLALRNAELRLFRRRLAAQSIEL